MLPLPPLMTRLPSCSASLPGVHEAPRAYRGDLANTGKVLQSLTGSSQLTNLLRNRSTAAGEVSVDALGSQPPFLKPLLCGNKIYVPNNQLTEEPCCPCKRQGPPWNKWNFYIPARTYYKLCANGKKYARQPEQVAQLGVCDLSRVTSNRAPAPGSDGSPAVLAWGRRKRLDTFCHTRALRPQECEPISAATRSPQHAWLFNYLPFNVFAQMMRNFIFQSHRTVETLPCDCGMKSESLKSSIRYPSLI